MRSDNLKLNKFTRVMFRSSLSVLCLFYIWDQLKGESPARLIEQLASLDLPQWMLLTFIFVLLPLNWGVEALKWRIVNRGEVNPDESFRAVLMGVALGFLIPARFGDVMGRLWSFRGRRSNGVSNALIAGATQFLATMLFGVLALVIIVSTDIPKGWDWLGAEIAIVGVILTMTGFIGLFMLKRILRWLQEVSKLPKLFKRLDSIDPPSSSTLISLLGWSVVRYIIFSSQFALALIMFGYSGSATELIILISVYYFLSSLMPTSVLGKLGIRESLALFIFSTVMPGAYNVIGATLLIWTINLAIPAALGSLVMVRSKINLSAR